MNFAKLDYKIYNLSAEHNKYIVYINGFADPVGNHKFIFEEVSKKGYIVVSINTPGHGKSTLKGQFEIPDLIESINDVLLALGLEVFEISGYSMGALIALSYASAYPSKVTKFKFIAPLCYTLKLSPKLILRSIPFAFHHVKNLLRWKLSRKTFPESTNFVYLLVRYIFSGILNAKYINIEKLQNKPINILHNQYDEIIDIVKVSNFVKNFKTSNLFINQKWTHDIYFKDAKEKLKLVEFLTA